MEKENKGKTEELDFPNFLLELFPELYNHIYSKFDLKIQIFDKENMTLAFQEFLNPLIKYPDLLSSEILSE